MLLVWFCVVFVESPLGIIQNVLFTCSCLMVEECRLLGFIVIDNVSQLRGQVQNGTLQPGCSVTGEKKVIFFVQHVMKCLLTILIQENSKGFNLEHFWKYLGLFPNPLC